ncbi:MAG: hypothetical protein QXO24_03510, partial [Candidatus Micrarchaeaceae archaeon]
MGKLSLPLLLMATLVLFGIADAASNIIYVSNTITTPIDFPQNAIYTINGISGGVAPYTFNAYFTNANVPATNTFLGSNTFSPSATANAIILTINTITPNSIIVSAYNGVQSSATELFSNTITTGGTSTIYGSWTFNAFFVDSTGANTIASVNSLTIDPALTATSLTPSNTILDSGQYVTYNVIINGGTLPITAKLILVSNTIPISINGNTVVPGTTYNTIVLGSGSAEPNTITFNSLLLTTSSTAGGNVIFEVNAIDSASTPVVYTAQNTITLNPAPTLTSLTPSNSILDYGQSVTYNVILSGGTGPFTVNLMNNGVVVNTIIWSTLTPVGNVITFGANIPAIGPQTFNVIATDNGASTPYVFNSVSNTITVNTAPTITLTPSNTILDSGQYEVYTVKITGGTGPFHVELYNITGNKRQGSNVTITSPGGSNTISFQANTLTATTLTFNAIATDTGTTTPYVFNSISNTITVNPAPTLTSLTPSNTILDSGQSVTYNVILSGGTGPFTVNLVNNG